MGEERLNKTIVLVTEGFPLSGVTENSFIMPEIDALSKSFKSIYILPIKDEGWEYHFPNNVIVDRTLACPPKWSDKFKLIWKREVWTRLFGDMFRKNGDSRLNRIRKSIAYSIYVKYHEKKLRRFIALNELNVADTVYYTFWFEFVTSALCNIEGLKVVTRAHGHDLYENGLGYISPSWRRRDLKVLKECYAISDLGTSYLRNRYKGFESKVHTRYLGSRGPLPRNNENDGFKGITFFCCSRLSPEKGVLRQADFIKAFAVRNRSTKVRWILVGDGPERMELDKRLQNMPSNLKVELTGALPNDKVHQMLSTRNIDFFVLTSYTEGLPISICEAFSYGIPVIATSVGGVPEIVSEKNGLLLSCTPDANEFCEKVDKALPDLENMRNNAYHDWESRFDALKLRDSFVGEIASI